MAAYVMANIQVTDAEGYEEYRKLSGPSLEPFGGKFLTRGGETTVLEGDWQPARLVLLEFPDAASARAWYDSEAYVTARAIRQRTAVTHMLLIEGV